jgi:hypothetical protein
MGCRGENDSLIDAFIPVLNATRNREWSKYNACTRYEQLELNQLFQSTGCIDAIRDMVWKALCMLAAWPLDFKNGQLEKGDAPILLRQFQEDLRMLLFRHHAFESAEFYDLMHRVKEQQDELDEKIKLSISPRDQNAVENWLNGYVVKDLEALFLLYRGLRNNQVSQQGGNPANSIQEGRLTAVDAPAP